MSGTIIAIGIEARPYRPSWIDRFTNWVEELRMPAWIFYVGLGLVLILIQMLILWLDHGLQSYALLPVIIFNALTIPYLLGLVHLLDNQAVTALNSMRPALAITEPEFDKLQYKLSTMPSRATLIAGLTMMAMLILSERAGLYRSDTRLLTIYPFSESSFMALTKASR